MRIRLLYVQNKGYLLSYLLIVQVSQPCDAACSCCSVSESAACSVVDSTQTQHHPNHHHHTASPTAGRYSSCSPDVVSQSMSPHQVLSMKHVHCC